MIKEIGGFFEISFGESGRSYHSAMKLNSGRNALKYLLKAALPDKIYLPYYICDSVIEPINALKINYEFYHIDEKFDPVFDTTLRPGDRLLYVNYFGIKDPMVKSLSGRYKGLIVDNTQAFFSLPINGMDTFYSPRKFFGVADGGYLYTANKIEGDIEQDVSCKRYEHLLKRFDVNAKESYRSYLVQEDKLKYQPIKKMSKLTNAILENVDYRRARSARINNFLFLHSALSRINELNVDIKNLGVPMAYPFLSSKRGLKEFLIRNKIYVPIYWKEVCGKVDRKSVEHRFTKNLLPLPIDQRYGIEDMKRICSAIKGFKR